MKLYTFEISGNSYKVRLLLSFLGLAYEAVRVDFFAQEQRKAEFLAINPRGEIPVLEDNGLVLRDSAAILVYLAGKYGHDDWWSKEAAEQAEITEWLAFAASWVQFGVFTARTIAFGISCNGLPPGVQDNPDAAMIRARRSLEILDGHLGVHAWLACKRPTIADIAVFPYVAWAPTGNIPLELYPHVRAWIERFKRLPGFITIRGLDDPEDRGQ
jgi:glutathione S-transferase